MSTGRIRHIQSQLGGLSHISSKRELSSHTKNLSLSGHQNVGLRHSSSAAQRPISDQYRYKSMNEIDFGHKKGEHDDNNFLHALHSNDSLLHIPQGHEKKIFDKMYKVKTLKFKPYLNECDTKVKKSMSELQSVKKPKSRRESKNIECIKNYINYTGQISHRDALNASSRRLDESGNTSQNREKGINESDKSKANKIVSLDLQNALLAKLKENPSQSQTTQRSRLKLSEPPYPTKLAQKIQKKNSVNQLRRIGDLEMLKVSLKSQIQMSKEGHVPVEKPVRPPKGHKRGLSMDQASVSLNKSLPPSHQKSRHYINPGRNLVEAQHTGNIPRPSQENNPQYQDPKFYEEFFGSTQLTFEFERNIISQLNRKKNETNTTMLGSTVNTRNNPMHSRNRSIEESNTGSLFKSNSRWSSQKISSREDMPAVPGNSYLQETLNDTQKIENIIEVDY